MTGTLKPFQQATVDHAVERLMDTKGSRRFLVADEVGLGKTHVAQGIIQRLLERRGNGKGLSVFYVCSSLGIASQNRKRLLEFLPKEEREAATVAVDRLTLLPVDGRGRAEDFTLFTLTTGTMPSQRTTGRADERALLAVLLRRWFSLKSNSKLTAMLQGSVGNEPWEQHLSRAESRLPTSSKALMTRFRHKLAERLELAPAAWTKTFESRIRERLEQRRNETIHHLRLALSLAALDELAPDLVIVDEFQRFFDKIAGESGEDADLDAQGLLRRILEPREGPGPAVLLLSATPYRLYGDLASGGAGAHHQEFIDLMGFLHGPGRSGDVEALQHGLDQYKRFLRTGRPD